ncbi:MAG TPA: phosphoribosyltransferase family protein [Nitrososphaera sp.]|jgi:hypoxanthine phosphoribosyltransferase|nr:phosphoribosyltransferase family protein [Nitrososphaera sp.]
MPTTAADRKRIVAPPVGDEDACYNCKANVNAAMMKASISGTSGKVASKIEGREACSWFEIHYLVKELARKIVGSKYDCILGIANGGVIPAKLLAEELRVDAIQLVPVRKKQVVISEMPKLDEKKKYLVIDDIYDTGATYGKVAEALKAYSCDYAFCMSRYEQSDGLYGRILNHNRWIVFPWELS